MAIIQFYPLDISVKSINQRASIVLHGRTIKGEVIAVVDSDYLPYFYVLPQGEDTSTLEYELMNLKIKSKDLYYGVLEIEKKSMKLKEKEVSVFKVYYNNPFGANMLYNEITKRADVQEVYEHDIPFINSYLMDKNIVPGFLTSIEGEVMNLNSKVPVIRANEITQSEGEFIESKILSFDIETYSPKGKSPSPNQDPITMISFYSENFKKVITWKKFETEDENIEFVPGEFELLTAFKKTIEEFQPDFLVGYNSDTFDFHYLKRRAEKYGVRFDLGLDHSLADIGKNETNIRGVTHIDIYKFVSRILGSKLATDTYRLGEVAIELLGEEKKNVDLDSFSMIWDTQPEKLKPYCDYNLKDAELIYKLSKKVLPLIKELVKLTALDLFGVSRGSYSQYVEGFLMKESRYSDELILPKPLYKEYAERKTHSIETEHVSEPNPGIYNNVAVYDFTALYPSIVATHNISPGSLGCRCCDEIVPTQETHFCQRVSGFVPKLINSLIDRKQRIYAMASDDLEQKKLLSARQESLSIISNALYAHFGYPYSRWYDRDCAIAINAYAKVYVTRVIDSLNEKGFEVLYADSDEVFVHLVNKTKEDLEKFFDELNTSLPEKMNLVSEGVYPKALFVSAKSGKGARRKYALLSDKGYLKIKGLEATKANTATIAKEIQEKVLNLILKDEGKREALDYVKKMIEDVKEHRISISKMIIYTNLQKDLSKYENIAPHVAVARKMLAQGFSVAKGSIIPYVVSSGEGSIAERSTSPNEVKEYDAEYYVEHQIIPVVEKIFEASGIDLNKTIEEKEQSSLSEFI